LLDQCAGGDILERRGEELIGIIISEVETLGRGQTGIILCPRLDLPFGIVGVIELGDQVVVGVVIVVEILTCLSRLVWALGKAHFSRSLNRF